MRPVLLIVAVVLLVRLPFLNQAIQGDDVYYLACAQRAQVDPLHPLHFRYVSVGAEVDMRGFPHPPGNAWFLGAILAALGDVSEIPFHALYLVFSFVALAATWALARRFSSRPVWATLLAAATPAFVVNGNSLESDLPFLAFWLASLALWVRAVDEESRGKLWACGLAMALAALMAYQAVALVPVAGLYLWLRRRHWKPAWAVALTPAAVLLAWQVFERASTGELPAAVLAGYFQSYGLQSIPNKFKNAAALVSHSAWLVFPALLLRHAPRPLLIFAGAGAAAVAWLDPHPLSWASFGIGLLLLADGARRLWKTADRDERFLWFWFLCFFCFALLVFFAGSARYLLPAAAPLAILVVNRFERTPGLLAAGLALQFALSLGLAAANYHHWDGYRQFVHSIRDQFSGRRVWVNGEWGLRFYAEAEGALPMTSGQAARPGDLVLSSKLAFPVPYTTGGGVRVPLAEQAITSPLPFRLIALESRSAYSTAARGSRPFDLAGGAIDVVRADAVVERQPVLSFLPMSAPEVDSQIVSGTFQLEAGAWRWTGGRVVVLLKGPPLPMPLGATFRIADQAPGRRVTLAANGVVVADRQYSGPGLYVLRSPPVEASGETVTAVITVDKTFRVPGDDRDLGLILVSIGFTGDR